MRPFAFFIGLVMLFTVNLGAQSTSELEIQLDALLASCPSEVLVGKDNFEQEITYDKATPYRIRISKTEEDEEATSVEVNLGLITKVRDYSHKRDGISVILSSGTMATIKSFEGEEVDGYLKETAILAENINNGREMEELLKQILPLAKTAWEAATALPEGAEALQEFTGQQVGNSAFGDEEYVQGLEFLSGIGNAYLKTSGSANKDEEVVYVFNLADLDAKQIDIRAKGNEIQVSLETKRNRKYIEVQEEEDKSFAGDLDIIFDSFDDAQVFTYALQALIKESESAAKANIPSYSSTDEAVKELAELLSKTEVINVEQKLGVQCRTTLTVQDEDEELSFQFDFADLDTKDLSFSPKGSVVYLPLETQRNQKFIGVRAGDEVKNYDDELELQFNSIAQAKLAAHAVEYLGKNCPTEIATPSMDMILSLLKDAEREDGEVTQAGEVRGDNNCTMELTQTESGKKTEEAVYEFNLYDLDPKSGKISVKGTEVNVTFTTEGKEDIIQVLENNEEQTYTSTITFYTADLAAAKTLLTGISAAAAGCAEDKR